MEHTNVLNAIVEELQINGYNTLSTTKLRDILNDCGFETTTGSNYTGNNLEPVVKGAYSDLLKKAENVRKYLVDDSGQPFFDSCLNQELLKKNNISID